MSQQLRVWWIPQIPGESFYVSVSNLIEAKLLLNTLASYDKFQFEHRIKGDYANVGGLQEFNEEENEWWDYYLPEEIAERYDWEKEKVEDLSLDEIRKLYKEGILT